MNLGAIQSRRAPWLICIHFITAGCVAEYYLVETRWSGVLGGKVVLLGSLLEQLQLVLHRSYYEVVLTLLVVLWLFFGSIARTFGGLRSFVDLFVILVFYLRHFLSFYHLAALVVSRGDHWLSPQWIFAANHRQFQVIGFVHFRIFRAFANGSSCQSFFVSK